MTYTDLGEWCKEKFKLEKAPSNAVICQWLKPDKRRELLEFMEVETCAAKLDSKSRKQPENPEMEAKLFDWFRRHEQKQSVITDCVIQAKAKELCEKRKIPFKASRNWVRKFKNRHGIGIKVLHGEAGSADKQWVSVARAILPSPFKDTEAPESDDDENPLAATLAECAERTGEDARDDDSVEVKVFSLKEARAAAAGLKLFLGEN